MGQQPPDRQDPFEQAQSGRQVPPQYPQPQEAQTVMPPMLNSLPPQHQFQWTLQQQGQYQPPPYPPYTSPQPQQQQQNSIADETTQPEIDRIKGNRPARGSNRGIAITRYWLYLLVVGCVAIGTAVIVLIWVFHIGNSKNTSQHTATAIPANERQVVQTYNQAVTKHDWATVYAYTSSIVVSDYTQEQYAHMMLQKVQNEGTISSFIVTSSPQVYTNSDAAPYFTIQEQIVKVKNGATQTQSLISFFLLEDGACKYWFPKKV